MCPFHSLGSVSLSLFSVGHIFSWRQCCQSKFFILFVSSLILFDCRVLVQNSLCCNILLDSMLGLSIAVLGPVTKFVANGRK